MILENAVLGFDPETADKEIKEIFSDDLARTLWLAVISGHMTDPYFKKNCLAYAKIIKDIKKKGLLTAEQLFLILSGFAKPPGCGIIGSAEQRFAAELLPFINGEKTIKFTVNKKSQTKEEAFQERIRGLGPGKPR
jgi:hypothetical protein